LKRDFKILTEIGTLLNKEKNKPNKLNKLNNLEKDLSKNKLFPLSLFQRKGSFLNKESYDYLNSVKPTNLREWTPNTTCSNLIFHKTLINGDKDIKISPVNDTIYQYLKSFSIFNKRKNGIFIQYNQYIGYNFNSNNILLRGVEPQNKNYLNKNNQISIPLLENKLHMTSRVTELNSLKGISGITGYNQSANNKIIKYSYKLLFYFFKSMYCLISKPVFLVTPDKVTIQLFYFLNIPKFKVFKWYSILNNKLIRQKWYSFKKNIKLENYNNSSTPNLVDSNLVFSLLKRSKINTVLSSNKEMMNSVKLSWRIKKTLFRLNKKRNKVKNILFNLNKFNLFKVFSLKFKLICGILSNKFKKPVELQLIRIHQPYYDSNILVNLLSLNIKNKTFKSNVAIEKLYAKKAIKNLYDYNIKSVNLIPTFLSGIKIRIGGRLMREPIIPRITTKNFERGASSPGKVNFLDIATITNKNRKGSYTIKISSGQNFF
jgi:hypothetical protein